MSNWSGVGGAIQRRIDADASSISATCCWWLSATHTVEPDATIEGRSLVWAAGAIGIVRTRPLVGTMRDAVPSALFATQRAPSVAAIPAGPAPTWKVDATRFV